jgi:PmbA protein
MVLENTVSSRMVAPIISALNGAAIQQNNSFLRGKLGERLFSPYFQLFDTPHLYGANGSRYFDGEGIATKPMNIIENGVVNSYYINTYFSGKLDMPVTIEGPSVPSCKYSESVNSVRESTSLEGILKKCDKGIFITGFNGGNSNSSTGDFSFGVQGFYFENGDIIHPIKEMNITGNIITLWNNIIEIGTDPRESSRWLIPTLAFESVNFSGI